MPGPFDDEQGSFVVLMNGEGGTGIASTEDVSRCRHPEM
jgi:hypothetical protein